MTFISLKFLGFLLVVFIIYYLIPAKNKIQYIILLIVSILFYLSFLPKAIIFLLFSSLISYGAAILLTRCNNKQLKDEKLIKENIILKKVITVASVIINIGLLAVLKYTGFTISIINKLTGDNPISFEANWILPIGISFYSLQVVGYVIDVYRNKYQCEKNFFKYLLFVLYFPHILQGPIARFDKLSKTLYEQHKFEYEQFTRGIQLILWGYFQKMVIADRASVIVNEIFNNYQNYSGFQYSVAAILYAIQIYADFSGCVDIAKGISEAFGIKIMENFEQPYFATSIKDFWRRWHISLSSWLRDYMYIPLGGNRKGKIRKYLNVLVTFFASGIWHGVGFHFIVWGLMHGIYQLIGDVIEPARELVIKKLKINTEVASFIVGKTVITFLLVDFAWIFFRASSLTIALEMVKSIFTVFNPWILFDESLYLLGLSRENFQLLLLCIAILFVVDYMKSKAIHIRDTINKQNIIARWLIYFVAIFSILIFGMYGKGFDASSFIYMKF